MQVSDKVPDIINEIYRSAEADGFAGYDPFDGLNSKVFDFFPSMKKGFFGLAWIQLHKRSIINFRPVLGVPKKRNPKGIGLFILGLLEEYKVEAKQETLNTAIELADWLLQQQCDKTKWEHSCWGYHFDWNARAFYVPKGKPNIITTIYVSQALLALGKTLDNQDYIDAALDSGHFITKSLYTKNQDFEFFAYIPGEEAFVHNASLWGAAWLAVVASETNNNEFRELAIKVANQSVSAQKNDGSWVYGTRHHHQFIDGFHTGYNLEALHTIKTALKIDDFDKSIKLGLEYYRKELFEDSGLAKYYNTNKYPLDMHCVSQAIFTFLKVGGTREDVEFIDKVIDASISELFDKGRKSFSYQKTAKFDNKINYIRWTQAWVYYSFAFYNTYRIKT
ncbi:aspartate-semialdehyde dehydrogenase [Motilimonas pumila]|uniref:Aspartate-semialdehyde dehydrogenase n=1 Tax=Motilimonas pumila TaxID=2303987 RepID=A0A418YKZ1_9GAMM|nr:aspartate-semialdehyde dehydrogenase [Motilimonas pumila]RJG51629.1 aspartate-semialdehyde dehydrogenase [Motilimonas pumila]